MISVSLSRLNLISRRSSNQKEGLPYRLKALKHHCHCLIVTRSLSKINLSIFRLHKPPDIIIVKQMGKFRSSHIVNNLCNGLNALGLTTIAENAFIIGK